MDEATKAELLKFWAYMADKALDNGNVKAHMYWAKRWHVLNSDNIALPA